MEEHAVAHDLRIREAAWLSDKCSPVVPTDGTHSPFPHLPGMLPKRNGSAGQVQPSLMGRDAVVVARSSSQHQLRAGGDLTWACDMQIQMHPEVIAQSEGALSTQSANQDRGWWMDFTGCMASMTRTVPAEISGLAVARAPGKKILKRDRIA